MVQRLGSALVSHGGTTLKQYLDDLGQLDNIKGDIDVPATGLSIPSFTTLKGRQNIGMIGQTALPKGRFKKRGNATVTLNNQDPNAGELTVDTVAYVAPAWPDGQVYPQAVCLEGLAFEGDDAGGECGLAVLIGGKYSFRNLSFNKTKIALFLKDAWVSDMTNIRAFGQIRQDNGTSVNYINCWASSQNTESAGAFRLHGAKYFNMVGCASDGTLNTAYVFDQCQGGVLSGCGCEGADTVTANHGTALAFLDNNNLSITGFTCVPKANQPIALMTFGAGNSVTLDSFEVKFGVAYDVDMHIVGAGNRIVIRGGRFGPDGTRMPVITASADAVGSTITYYRADGKVLYCKVASAGVQTLVQRIETVVSCFFDSNGNLQRGHGVSRIAKEAAGVYRVHYDRPKENILEAQATIVNGNGFVTVLELSNSHCLVHVRNFSGVNVDAGVMLSASGWA